MTNFAPSPPVAENLEREVDRAARTVRLHHGHGPSKKALASYSARFYYATSCNLQSSEERDICPPSPPRTARLSSTRKRISRVGGRDPARCGAKDDPRYRVEARYVDIVEMRRVVWTEMVHELDKLLATNITTFELRPDGERTQMRVTVQVTSLVGPGMIRNTKDGHEGSLARMARYLEREAP